MPEIAEVARVTHFLRQHLVGKKIGKVVAPDDSSIFGKVGTSGPAFQAALSGRRVVAAGSQGKYFWLQLDAPPHPVLHLGMTGWVHVRGAPTAYTRYAERMDGAEKEAWPPKYWKFHLATSADEGDGGDGEVCVAFTDARRFGRVRLVDCPGAEIRAHSPLVENGPDPVVDRERFTEEYLSTKMKARHVPIKALLLDQAMISGIGNWVGDEIMYQAALHPEQYSDDFSDAEIAKLYKAICYVCDTAVEHLGDSDKFPADWLFHHRWGKGKKDAAKTLPSGEKMVFLTVGGRTSCVVPSRQKKTGRVAAGVKEEEAEAEAGPKKETKAKRGKNSHFFDGGEDAHDEPEAKAEARPAKKARGAARKPIKEEDDEPVSVDRVDSKPKKGTRKTKEKPASPPDIGRRRSTRLSKTTS
ncbi:formamidopyrimidine-DNA glycosylase [Hypoxylon argillaceum]|nr:formamidopyrimidine-DNA glycosylase [Hypoxylon argillaceum]KAI1153718.1 formamidopyrimidine-DNA glycosylase [Nemania diffusa]